MHKTIHPSPISVVCACISILFFPFAGNTIQAQDISDTITVAESREIITFLSADKLKGRVNFTDGQIEAANFIGKYFRRLNLFPYAGVSSYYQPFVIQESSADRVTGPNDVIWNGKKLSGEQFEYSYDLPELNKRTIEEFQVVQMTERLDQQTFRQYERDSFALLFWWNSKEEVSRLITDSVSALMNRSNKKILLVSSTNKPMNLVVKGNAYYKSKVLNNIVAVLPGLSKAHEAIIFSAHYDHIAMDENGRRGLYNGANDNASGVTALLQLAKYYALKGPQERTIIFIAFAGEELGLMGSKVFTQKIIDEQIAGVVNIEMIGKHNAVGKNAFFITGQRISSMPEIFYRNLFGSEVRIMPESSAHRDLFARSDNFSFYKKGIPAHSIMCSDDEDPCYHQTCDDAHLIDIENMTVIIRSIVKAAGSLVNGTDMPVLFQRDAY